MGVDDAVAVSYGRLAAAVVEAGRQLRRRFIDLLVAATAHAHDAKLSTRHAAHFMGLDDLIEVIAVSGWRHCVDARPPRHIPAEPLRCVLRDAVRSSRLSRGDLNRTHHARQAGGVGHPQAGELVGSEPAKIVMLLGRGVAEFPVPPRDEECVHLEGGVTEPHRDGAGIADVDAELLEAFTADCLERRLSRLDMPAGKVPAVGIPLTTWMAMHQQHPAVAHEGCDRDRDPGDHSGMVGAKAPRPTAARRPALDVCHRR